MKFNPLIPELTVLDIGRTKRFYMEVLGFSVEYERAEDKFAFLSLEGIQLMVQEENGVWTTGELIWPFGRGINFEMTVSDVCGLCKRVKAHGHPLFRPLTKNAYRTDEGQCIQHEFLVQDPDGYLLRFTD